MINSLNIVVAVLSIFAVTLLFLAALAYRDAGPATVMSVGGGVAVAAEAADAARMTVNGERLIDDLAFRTATPFLDVPTEVDLDVEADEAVRDTAAAPLSRRQ